MKTHFLLLISLFISISSFSQSRPKVNVRGERAAPVAARPSPGYSIGNAPAAVPPSPAWQRAMETPIGLTRFELQTTASLGRRVATFDGGKVSAAWLFGLDEAGGWPDRGTGYNHFDGEAWGPTPEESLEAIRSGYPSFSGTPGGVEVVLSHKNTSSSQWFLQAHTKMPGETAWNETEIPSTVPGGPVWAKIATGGPDGNSVHCLAVAVAPDFGGVIYEGMNQHPLYYRSADAGQTWDMVDIIIPGLDSNYYSDIFAESYNIDAHGQTVALAVFDSWGDIAVFKSEDNGATWAKTIINDFPLDKYDGSGYGPGDIPFDPNAPDSVSIHTSDYSGSVLVDNQGKVHVFFGQMYVYASGASQFLYLDASGIAYWNEDFGPDSIRTIADVQDFDGDGEVTIAGDLAGLRYTNAGLTSYPSSGVDADGNLYLVYSAMREGYTTQDETLRHIFIIKSEDGGTTWSDPFDLINEETSEFFEFVECAYPSIPSRIGDALNLVYMQDFDPGLTTEGEVLDQLIMHIALDKNTFGIYSGVEGIPELGSDLVLAPNPSGGLVQVSFSLTENAEVSLHIFNLLGEPLGIGSQASLPAGPQTHSLDLSRLNSGIYLVQATINNRRITKKIVVR